MYSHLLRRLLLGVLLALPGIASAQTGTITGRTVDATDRSAVPGVNVVLEGTTLGAASDAEGYFEFTAPPGDYTLVASFVGYEPYRMPVTVNEDASTEVVVELTEGGINLDEVVVTALGIQREERSLGYAVQEVEGAQLANAAESNLVNTLGAQTAGVHVTSSSGQPGKAARIVIRGNASLLGENQPLFVVDGVPVSNEEDDNPGGPAVFTGGTTNRGLDIDPNIIEDVTVLKGASATALYGSRAANGAIIITTKGGGITAQRSAPSISFTSRVRFDENVITGFQDEYLLGENGFYKNGIPEDRGGYVQPNAVDIDGQPITATTGSVSWGPHKDEVPQDVLDALAELEGEYPDLDFVGDDGQLLLYNPRDQFFQTGTVLENSISLSGGLGGTNYFLAVSDLRQEGTVRNTDLTRTSVLAKFGTELGDKWRVQSSANYIRTDNVFLLEGNGPRAYMYTTLRAPISYDLSNYEFPDGTQRVFSESQSFNNPFWLAENQAYRSNVDRLIGSTSVTYDILPWLSLNERLGVDMYIDERKEEINIGTRSRPTGSMFDQKITRRQINSDLTLQATRALTEDFSINATVGQNVNSRYYEFNFVDGRGLGIPDFYNVSNASTVTSQELTEERMILSAYGQATIDYRDMAYLTLTGRNDWSSTLPKDNNSYFYPSASLGLIFTEFFSIFDQGPLSYGKLRGSVAQIGSDAPVYALSTTYLQEGPSDGQRGEINFPFNGVNGFVLSGDLGNPDLKPELSTEYEVGLDLRFFGQRARLDAAYYTRSTKDQIFEVPVSPATGYSNRLINAGEVQNRGYELTLGVTPIQRQALQWDLSANFSKNTTEVVELAEGVENIFLFGFTSPQIRAQPGKDGYGVIWAPRFERTAGGDLIIDEDGLPVWAAGDGAIGNVQPDWLANVRSALSFKGLTLSALFDIRHGGDVLNFDLFYSVFGGTAELTEDRGTTTVWDGVLGQTNEDGDYVRDEDDNIVSSGTRNTTEVMQDEAYYRNFYSDFRSTELFVEDGSYVKLRELSLSYNLPSRFAQRLGAQALSVTAVGRNLWIDSDFSYRDPEGSLSGAANGQGFYHGVTPSTRSYSIGLNLTI